MLSFPHLSAAAWFFTRAQFYLLPLAAVYFSAQASLSQWPSSRSSLRQKRVGCLLDTIRHSQGQRWSSRDAWKTPLTYAIVMIFYCVFIHWNTRRSTFLEWLIVLVRKIPTPVLGYDRILDQFCSYLRSLDAALASEQLDEYKHRIARGVMVRYVLGSAVALTDFFRWAISILLPPEYIDRGLTWKLDFTNKKAVLDDVQTTQRTEIKLRSSPLPGPLSRFGVSMRRLNSFLWWAAEQPWKEVPASNVLADIRSDFEWYTVFLISNTFGQFAAISDLISNLELFSVFVSGGIAVFLLEFKKHWILHNFFALAQCYYQIAIVSGTSFGIATMMSCGLIILDIVMVFFSPVMEFLATSFYQPGMLIFPDFTSNSTVGNTYLGLGDVIFPGILISLALRFDLHMHLTRLRDCQCTSTNGDLGTALEAKKVFRVRNSSIHGVTFKKPYFYASMTGYMVGLFFTVVALYSSARSQPACLYLLPGVLGAQMLTALWRKEWAVMWDYSETEGVGLEMTPLEKSKEE